MKAEREREENDSIVQIERRSRLQVLEERIVRIEEELGIHE